jgi:hypothetical protein
MDGTELQRFDGPAELASDFLQHLFGAGLSADNEFAVAVGTPLALRVLILDRKTRTWKAVLPEEVKSRGMAGFDGTTLVMLPEVGPEGIMRRYTRIDGPVKRQRENGATGGK